MPAKHYDESNIIIDVLMKRNVLNLFERGVVGVYLALPVVRPWFSISEMSPGKLGNAGSWFSVPKLVSSPYAIL